MARAGRGRSLLAAALSRAAALGLTPTFVASAVALFERRNFSRELEPDPIIYLTIGSEVLHGAMPYRDVFDHKGPLTYWLYAGLELVLPSTYAAMRLALFALFVLSIALLVSLVRRHASNDAAWIAALVYAIVGSSAEFGGANPNLEQVALPLMLGAVWAADRYDQTRALSWAVASGASCGALVMLKPTLGFIALISLALVAREDSRRAPGIAAALGGAAVVCVLTLAPYAAAGALGEMREAVVDYNRLYQSYATDALDNHGLRGLLHWAIYTPAPSITLVAVVAAAISWRAGHEGRLLWIAVAWGVLAFLAAKFLIRDFRWYFVPMTPAMAIAIGLGAAALGRSLESSFARWALYGLIVLPLLVQFAVQPSLDRSVAAEAGTARNFTGFVESRHRPIGASNTALAAAVRRVTPHRAPIFVAGERGLPVYWLADRRPASRYVFPTYMRPQPPYAAVVRDLQATRPAAIVVIEGYDVRYLDPVIRGQRLVSVPAPPGARIYVPPAS